jgi:hypothetical protein
MQLEPHPGGAMPSSAQLTNHSFGELPDVPPTLLTMVQPFHVEAIQLLAQPLLKLSDQITV